MFRVEFVDIGPAEEKLDALPIGQPMKLTVGEIEQRPVDVLPVDLVMIARPMISGICGTTALPRVRSRSTRLGTPSATRPTAGSALHCRPSRALPSTNCPASFRPPAALPTCPGPCSPALPASATSPAPAKSPSGSLQTTSVPNMAAALAEARESCAAISPLSGALSLSCSSLPASVAMIQMRSRW
jgi:hypothetical protein